MQSGLNDFDVPGFDDALLKQGGSVHSPLEFLSHGGKPYTVYDIGRDIYIYIW